MYYPDSASAPPTVAVNVLNRTHSITAQVEIPTGGAEGVLLSHGSSSGGYTLFLQHNPPHYVHNYVGVEELYVGSTDDVPEGSVELRFEFEPAGPPDIPRGRGTPGRARLFINRMLVGQADFPPTIPLGISLGEGLMCGRDSGASVTSRYRAPFPFTGTIHSVTVDVSGEKVEDKEAQFRIAMARQ